jgi:hypothetical protein
VPDIPTNELQPMEEQLFANDSKTARAASAGVLFVDLDGTLLKGD